LDREERNEVIKPGAGIWCHSKTTELRYTSWCLLLWV